MVVVLAGLTYFVIRIRVVLTPFLLAVIAYILYPVVQLFEQRFVPPSCHPDCLCSDRSGAGRRLLDYAAAVVARSMRLSL